MTDNVIRMAYDMNRGLIEREWILLRARKLAKRINAPNAKNNINVFADIVGLQFVISQTSNKGKHFEFMANPRPNSEFYFVYMLGQLYPHRSIFEGISRFGNEHDRSVLSVKFEDDKGQYLIQASDNEMAKKSSLGETLPHMRNCLLAIVAEVEELVAQQKRLVGELFS